jgi:filamentous hemagglutinin
MAGAKALWGDLTGIAELIAHPIKAYEGLEQFFTDENVREKVGDEVMDSLKESFVRIQKAYEEGGDQNAEQLGIDLGNLMWHAASVAMFAEGAATGAVKVGNLSIKLTEQAAQKLAVSVEKLANNAFLKAGGIYDSTGKPLLDLKQLTIAQKSTMGELFGQNIVEQYLPNGEKLARSQSYGQNGIDDLFKVDHPDVDFVVIEYKFDTSKLAKTNDGLQGSNSWVLGSDRLEKAVGQDLAQTVKAAVNNGRTETWLVRTRPNGSTEIKILDSQGRIKSINSSASKILPFPVVLK